jgi:hypothetical protein
MPSDSVLATRMQRWRRSHRVQRFESSGVRPRGLFPYIHVRAKWNGSSNTRVRTSVYVSGYCCWLRLRLLPFPLSRACSMGAGLSCGSSTVVSSRMTMVAAFSSGFRSFRRLTLYSISRLDLRSTLHSLYSCSSFTSSMCALQRRRLILVGCSVRSTTIRPVSSAALSHTKAHVIARYMSLTGTNGFP